MNRLPLGILLSVAVLAATITVGGLMLALPQMTPPTQSVQPVPTPPHIAVPAPAPVSRATMTTYINNEYAFSYTYPSWWNQRAHYRNPDKPNDLYDHDLVFSTEFDDPIAEREMLLWKCVNDRENGWYSNDVTPSECDAVLKEYDSGNLESLPIPPHPTNIFIRVFKTGKPLSNWLVSTYRLKGTELEYYQVGKEIELAGENGFLSSTGCCMSIDNSYVVKHGSYIYEFGSNAASSTDLIESMKGGFRFLDANPTPTSTTTVSKDPLLSMCGAKALSASIYGEGASGSMMGEILFHNKSPQDCMLEGYPQLKFLDQNNKEMKIQYVDSMYPAPEKILLAPGAEARALIQWRNGCSIDLNPTEVLITLPTNDVITTTDLQIFTPRCDDPTYPSTMGVSPFVGI